MGNTLVVLALAVTAAATKPAKNPPPGPELASVTVSNPLAVARGNETIAIARAEIVKVAPSFDIKAALVFDPAGKPVLSQLVDSDGDEEADEIVWQTDLAASQSKMFKLRAGARTPAETTPKEPLVSSGIDTWVKRARRLLTNDWLMTGDYHHDTGEGADFYGVGKSRGCGGLGVWSGGKLMVSRNFTTSRVLAAGPIRLVFELRYAPWDAGGGVKITETKRVTLDAGSHFNRFETTFTGAKAGLSVGVGIAKHAGSAVVVDAGSASMRVWEPLKGKQGEDGGNLGCAVVLPAGSALEEHHGDVDYLVVTPVSPAGKLVYHVGSWWDRAGKGRDAAAWGREVQALGARVAAPVKIEIAATSPKP